MMVVVQVVVVALLCAGFSQTEEILAQKGNVADETEKIHQLKTRLKLVEETVLELKSKLDLLQTENNGLKTTVETMRQKNEAKNVAFSASLITDEYVSVGPFANVESPLIYRRVFSNFGNGYNSETGVFTAPVKGVYYLRFYAHCHTGNKMAVSLYKNGIKQCAVFSERPYTNGNASNGIVLSLEVGDEIYTKLWDGAWVYDDPESYTSFGGFLLFPL